MRTLYISDLDGTLLRNDQTVSPFTADAISNLTEKGMLFSYATARSIVTASKVTSNLRLHHPVIVFNGTFIVEPQTKGRLHSNIFTPEESKHILDTLTANGIFPIVNALFEEDEKFSYLCGKETRGILTFLDGRKGDVRNRPVFSTEALYEGDLFHIACIDESEKLLSAFDRFKKDFPCVLYRDMYSGDTWLELHPRGASKAQAALTLKQMLHCDRIICFGDGKNDIPMFEIANECYAVANAEEELKAIATAVIESNENDGVAKWLIDHI